MRPTSEPGAAIRTTEPKSKVKYNAKIQEEWEEKDDLIANKRHIPTLLTSFNEVSSCEFRYWFPVLDKLLDEFEDMTDFLNYKLRLKFASDEELRAGTRHFFKNQMSCVI